MTDIVCFSRTRCVSRPSLQGGIGLLLSRNICEEYTHKAKQCKSKPKSNKNKNKKNNSLVSCQLALYECFGIEQNLDLEENPAIEVSGDRFPEKANSHMRFVFQNVHVLNIREALEVLPEAATIGSLQLDMAALTETNADWNQSKGDRISHQLSSHLQHNIVVCVSNVSTK